MLMGEVSLACATGTTTGKRPTTYIMLIWFRNGFENTFNPSRHACRRLTRGNQSEERKEKNYFNSQGHLHAEGCAMSCATITVAENNFSRSEDACK